MYLPDVFRCISPKTRLIFLLKPGTHSYTPRASATHAHTKAGPMNPERCTNSARMPRAASPRLSLLYPVCPLTKAGFAKKRGGCERARSWHNQIFVVKRVFGFVYPYSSSQSGIHQALKRLGCFAELLFVAMHWHRRRVPGSQNAPLKYSFVWYQVIVSIIYLLSGILFLFSQLNN